MTMKRILQCVLVSLVLATAGCGFLGEDTGTATQNGNVNSPRVDDKNANNARVTEKTPQVDVDFKLVDDRIEKVDTAISDGQQAKEVKQLLDQALLPLGKDGAELRDKCKDCKPETLLNLQKTRQALVDAQKLVGKEQQDKDLSVAAQANVQGKLVDASQALVLATNSLVPAVSPLPTPTPPPPSTEGSGIWDIVTLALKIVGGLLVLVLVVTGLQYLRKQSRRNVETHVAHVASAQLSATRDGHKELADRLSTVAATQKEISNGLIDLHTEVRSLARLVRESLSDRNDRRHTPVAINYQTHAQDFSVKDEPEFPVSADDYLGKMTRYGNVVRPDFQNGILVSDPEGKGHLMLIRDSRLADEAQPLFVIPRTTQFQTKQDFYTYYEKYYDCVRPSAGDVWILGPAVVEKVAGGWRLREKGMLEIR